MGDLSAGLSWLRVEGRAIVAGDAATPIRLRGVNRSGLEYAEPGDRGFLEAAGFSEEEVAEIVTPWRARVLRLPFNQEFALRGRGRWSAEDYLSSLDRVIHWAARLGCYTLLDLQWLDATRAFGTNADGTINRVPPLPDAGSIDVWATLAARYHDEPAVLVDLFNEPHDPLPDDPHELMGIEPDGSLALLHQWRVGMTEWQPWARRLIDVIRGQHPAALIFVSGVRWAYDLRGMPLTQPDGRPIANLVYSTHVYPWSRTSALALGGWERDWYRAFGWLTSRAPVFAGEWGGFDHHVDWGRRALAYFDRHDMGWCAWSWADDPCLVRNCRSKDYSPTAFGEIVRDALRV